MDTPTRHEGKLDDRYRKAANIRPHAGAFPYVTGALFSGSVEVPRFSRMVRNYLLHIGGLNWKEINADTFASMIQAVADDEELVALGMQLHRRAEHSEGAEPAVRSSLPASLLPVRVLGALFRRLFLTRVLAPVDAGKLAFFDRLALTSSALRWIL